ncbi:PTS system mannitol-specific transporter subunit IIA [Streptococcus gallolyticus]|uniref:Mannitol-specific phosphotransferase enzyme IIA component n=1 Tax=Streptococcus gallolyticus TaxID=315405 RepID=A0AA94M2B7_9STRE|nr:PTS sugar transporter subunit IIA [Streptococcus gallolyticus]MCF2566231.1 PTS sugar transporter subunit IIA [Streptococcus pasteurianus]AQP42039.1 PTS system mannitol-specific transporter subunitIIA [Streptococcus gallolyticus subsp. gallolyticus DSM 16831]MCF1633435.1 PTS sugar transporter subunit IIA [Streptococcus gallolyticus]MCQ9216678.1 PTS sugar transporter subunit IIA [Streptococcus gallolyticus]MCY7155379.1 PTS sugar transporter subunit IIA [Streptococcus gallolyticus subsp. gallo
MDFQKDLIKLNESFDTKEEAIRYCGRLLFQGGYVQEDYIEAMIQRDNDLSVYMGNFIAIPHGTDEAKEKVLESGITVVQVPDGVNFGTEDNPQIATVLFGIAGIGNEHLEMIQKISIFCADVDNVVKLADAQSKDEIIRLLNNVE